MTKGGLNSIFRGYNSDTEGLQGAVAGERWGNEIPTKPLRPLAREATCVSLTGDTIFLGLSFFIHKTRKLE